MNECKNCKIRNLKNRLANSERAILAFAALSDSQTIGSMGRDYFESVKTLAGDEIFSKEQIETALKEKTLFDHSPEEK